MYILYIRNMVYIIYRLRPCRRPLTTCPPARGSPRRDGQGLRLLFLSSCGSIWDRFGPPSGPIWVHFGPPRRPGELILLHLGVPGRLGEPRWGPREPSGERGSIFDKFWVRFGTPFGAHFEAILGPFFGSNFGSIFGSPWIPSGPILGSVLGSVLDQN